MDICKRALDLRFGQRRLELFEGTEVFYAHVDAGRSTDLLLRALLGLASTLFVYRSIVKLQTWWKLIEVFDSMAGQLLSSGLFEG